MGVDLLRSALRVEPPVGIARIVSHAERTRAVRKEPRNHLTQQRSADTASLGVRHDVERLELRIGAVSRRMVVTGKSHSLAVGFCEQRESVTACAPGPASLTQIAFPPI